LPEQAEGTAVLHRVRNLRQEKIMSAIETAPARISWTVSETTLLNYLLPATF